MKPLFRKNTLSDNNREKYMFVFLASFISVMLILLPIAMIGNGIFVYYGDFNDQQIMFYDHVQKAAKDGALGWDWGTDLGSSFIGTYSFYLLGSPFFWLTSLFPRGAAPYLIPWFLALKTGVAAITSYAYIRRFVKSREASAIGALLYAFSGFQIYNVLFNHFHDVTAFFPLLLLALELNIQENRKGVFALTVGLMATINYFFFAGQITFLIIYFICRCFSKDFKITFKKFCLLAVESILGVMLSAIILLPSAISVLGNPRVEGTLSGVNMFIYVDKYRYIKILQSFFMLPDPPIYSNIFYKETGMYASIAGYLPLFSMAGVIAFMRGKKGHWAKRLLIVCMIFAFIPILNSSFFMFNGSYYARWYYMPILIMAMMTSYTVQNEFDENRETSLKKGIPAVAAMLGIFLIIAAFPSQGDDGKLHFFNTARYPELLSIQLGVTIGAFGLLVWYLYFNRSRENRNVMLTAMTVGACTLSFAGIVWFGMLHGQSASEYYKYVVNGGDYIDMEKTDGEFYRIDTGEDYENAAMFWGYSTMRCFNSTVEPSIMEFYEGLGLERGVASRIEPYYYPLRGLLSVKYYIRDMEFLTSGIINADYFAETDNVMTGFEYERSSDKFYIYKNNCYLPMGFAYDTYLTHESFDALDTTLLKASALVDSLVLSDEQIEKYSDIIAEQTREIVDSEERYFEEIAKKRAQSCYFFKEDSGGFTAKINLESDRLVFFSVPYNDGWSATVNGKAAEVEKVSNGMMAVRVPAGEDNEIRFDFTAPGYRLGAIITACGWALLIAYVLIWHRVKKRIQTDNTAK